ncbi:MAG: DUF3179 domain-containing protein [Propylenella sp.]
MRPLRFILVLLVAALAIAGPALAETKSELVQKSLKLFSRITDDRYASIDYFTKRGKTDAIPLLIFAMRFIPERRDLEDALVKITGEQIYGWNEWMMWQEAHPEIEAFDGFAKVHAEIHSKIVDPNFALFLGEGKKHEIRIEEIVWGGVKKDAIPALNHPRMLPADEATYLDDADLLFGISINGDARAYPLRILDWHEMLNDTIGGIDVSLAYCTLCGSGILFETKIDRFDKPLIFGSSGFLYRSNKLMYDTRTNSLWNQFTGRPVVGRLVGSGIELKTRPVVITSWGEWRREHPDTTVTDIETGFERDYSSGAAYADYFASPDLMFPTIVDQSELKQKDYVFALRSSEIEKAWPLGLFEGGAVINDRAGALDLVLVGDAATRTVRAYRSEGFSFEKGASLSELRAADGSTWRVTEDALVGPDGRTLGRLPGHIAYWFAWSGHFGDVGEVGGK